MIPLDMGAYPTGLSPISGITSAMSLNAKRYKKKFFRWYMKGCAADSPGSAARSALMVIRVVERLLKRWSTFQRSEENKSA